MNNQQHPVLGSAMNTAGQRGMPASQHMYQLQQSNMSQLSHLQQQQQAPPQQQQQSHMMNSYSTQAPPDVSSRQYSPSMSTMNGNAYQPLTGPSLHSNLNMDNSVGFHQHNDNTAHQFNQQQHQQYHQPQMQQAPQHHQQQQPPQHHQLPTHQHQLPTHQHYPPSSHAQPPQQQPPPSLQPLHNHQKPSVQQHQHNIMQSPPSHQYNMHQGSSQGQQPQHPQVKSYQQQSNSNQQHIQHQPYSNYSIQQRNVQQQQSQQKYERPQQQHQQQPPPQPRRILQNTNAMHNRMNQNQRPVATEVPVAKEMPRPAVKTLDPAALDKKPNEGAAVDFSQAKGDGEEGKENNEEKEIGQEITDDAGSASENTELANTKEKTPMTLIQELAKFNKIERKYTLLDEQGPAHKKTFYVKLLLGTEEYSCSGASIRKAQQSAAAIALKETKFKHPPVKPAWKAKKISEAEDGKLTPTVELNGLAMKRGETAIYKAIEPQQPPYYYPPGMDPRALYSHRYYHYMRASRDPRFARGYWPMRYHFPRMNRAFYVSLRVGHREFIGDGPTRQAARHNAAIKALKVLRNLPEKEVVDNKTEEEEAPKEEEEGDDGLKSHVTSVHETAFRRKLAVTFEVIRESGPPHMKTFVTRCTVGDLVTDGEGNSKKISKKIAAEQMCEKLKELPALPATAIKQKPKTQVYKKKNRIKAEIQQQKADPNYGVGVNPISRLIQIMCAQKKREPVYSLLAERGISCRKEFIMQIEVDGQSCTGSGPNKKLAKRAAAEAMLDLLGYNKPAPQPAKSSIKQPSEGNGSNGEKKVHFSESVQKGPNDGKSGNVQQKVPGLLHLPPNTMVNATVTNSTVKSNSSGKESLVNLSNILKPNWRPELQLRELCKALQYPLELNDFTKTQANNSLEYIARITVGPSDSQQNFLGSSNSLESARDMACMEALKVLVSKVKEMNPAGDGAHIKNKPLMSRGGPGMRDLS